MESVILNKMGIWERQNNWNYPDDNLYYSSVIVRLVKFLFDMFSDNTRVELSWCLGWIVWCFCLFLIYRCVLISVLWTLCQSCFERCVFVYFEFFTDILLYSIFQLFVLPTTDLSLSDIIWLLSLVILIYFLCLLKVFIAIISRE